MVANLAEKVDECPPNRGRLVLLVYNWDRKNCPLYRIAGCPLFRGCLSIEVNGRTVGTFRIARYIMGVRFSEVSVKWGSTVLQRKEPIPDVQEVLTKLERSTCLMLCHVERAI